MTFRGIRIQHVVDLLSGLRELECYRKSFSWQHYRTRLCRNCDAEVLAIVHGFLDTIGQAPSDADALTRGQTGGRPPRPSWRVPIQEMSAGAAALDDPADQSSEKWSVK